jgi:hypothetical protein
MLPFWLTSPKVSITITIVIMPSEFVAMARNIAEVVKRP